MRSLRHNIEGGWYHITTRGLGRQRIFVDSRDREHFIELLEQTVGRYGIILHAYVLMDNHYHILIETPRSNASKAMQWLNLSYSVWYNVRHNRSGALFQARFKSIPIEHEGSWALAASVYLHLNPVRVKALGLSKSDRAAEKTGYYTVVPAATLLKRLDTLRNHRWSSYPVYAGYKSKPEWLTCAVVWRLAGGGGASYRRYLEDYVKQDAKEYFLSRVTAALAIGSTAFIEGLRKRLPENAGEQSNLRQWRRLLPFDVIKKAVSAVKGEEWDAFVNRHGDIGRDLALYYARINGGYTLHELGNFTQCNTFAVSKAVSRIRNRLESDQGLRKTIRKVEAYVKSLPDSDS